MKPLAALQHTFQKSVLHPSTQGSTAWFSARGRASPEIQLSVYTHAYRARLLEVLENDYPALRAAMGDDLFVHLADDYTEAHPSRFFSLRDFGSHMPAFILDWFRQQELHEDISWSHELAQFEWTLGQAFDAADDKIFSGQDMARIPPELWSELRFIIHSSVYRLDFEWNIPEIWQVVTSEHPDQVTAIRENLSPWLVWREGLITRFRSLEADEQRALDMILCGGSFSDVCEVLATLIAEEEVPLHAAGLLKGWLTQGLISGIV